MRSISGMVGGTAIGLAAAISIAVAQPADRVKAGALTCDISAGIGLIIGSQKEVSCLFTPDLPGPQEAYVGTIDKFGLDLGATSGGSMIWAVYAPTNRTFGALAGVYTGATAEATIAVGLGANVLVGGSSRTVALQPLSVQEQSGLNVAAGVVSLRLRPVQ